MKIFVLGCGSIGSRHVQNLKSLGFNNIIAYDLNDNLLSSFVNKYSVTPVKSIKDGVAQRPDVAFICLPTNFHIEASISLADAGIHLFIEKPLDVQLDNVPLLLEPIEKNQVINMVGCNYRFDAGMILMKQFLDEGQIGHPYSLRATFGFYLPDWRPKTDYRKNYAAKKDAGGGVILDRIHEIDYVLWLLGDVKAIYGLSSRLGDLDIETEDMAEIVLQHKNGVISNIHLDYLRREYLCACEICGYDGIISWDFKKRKLKLYKAANKEWTDYSSHMQQDTNSMYIEEVKYFLECVEENLESCNTVKDASHTLKIALWARESTLSKDK